jgi:hypothetical protein
MIWELGLVPCGDENVAADGRTSAPTLSEAPRTFNATATVCGEFGAPVALTRTRA